jgi:opacity protein-like surface antigen
MRIAHVRWMVLGCVLAGAIPLRASGQQPEMGFTGPLVWNIGGALLVPLSDSADRVDVGGGFAVGLTYNPSPFAGVQFEYGVDWANLKTGRLQSVGIGGNALLQYFNLNIGLHPAPSPARAIGFYVLGGGGLYYRSVDVTRATGTAVVPYCDPWLYYCSAVPVSTATLIGSRSSWDWGLDAGVGVTFAVSPPVRLYLEARYHYIFGPSFTDNTGAKRTADGQYLPITLGVRF